MQHLSSQNASTLPTWLKEYAEQAPESIERDGVFKHLAKLSEDELQLRAAEIKRLLRNSGFIEFGENLQWQLDPIPLLMPPQEWQHICDGIRQRIRLLSRVLEDINGPQSLMTGGVIRSTELLGHPDYLRERFTLPASEQGLFLVAMDIGRDSQGQYQIIQDHCQFPRGLGLLLENRIIARRVMSEEFAECGVYRVADFFKQLRQAITDSTPSHDPRVVILISGPDDIYYSEQAYLATYMGYTLVRSADLTVRKGKVWLKALDGLKPVDVILRWIEDRYLDSLEQSEYSDQGVVGLLQAVRLGNVKLLNPFGNALLQIPAIKNNLAAIAQQMLGESLILSEPTTLACDQLSPAQWPEHELRSHHDRHFRLDGHRHQAQIGELLAQPSAQSDYYFWRKVDLQQLPFWHNRSLEVQPVLFRCFALYHKGRVEILPSALCSSIANGGNQVRIKDTWVQASHQLESPVPVQQQLRSRKKMADLALLEGLIPSRTAENLYWLGCGLERCENLTRLLRLFIDRKSELAMYPDERNRLSVTELGKGIFHNQLVYPYASEASAETTPPGNKAIMLQALQSTNMAGSLYNGLTMVISCAMQVRELLSYDSLRIIENLEIEQRRLTKLNEATATHISQSIMDRVISHLMAFNGSIFDTMSVSNGSFMIEMGRRIERCTQLVAMIETLLTQVQPDIEQFDLLEAVLIAQVSAVTHCRRYRMHQSVATCLELLLLDAQYPRSLMYQVEKLRQLSKKLPLRNSVSSMRPIEKLLLQLQADGIVLDKEELLQESEGNRTRLLALMTQFRQHLAALQEVMQTQYFSHTKRAVKLNWSGSIESRGEY